MRSRLKCAIFSNSRKSSNTTGPRSPTVKEFWLSPTGRPASVVITLLFNSSAIQHLETIGWKIHLSLLALGTNANHVHCIPLHQKTAGQFLSLRDQPKL